MAAKKVLAFLGHAAQDRVHHSLVADRTLVGLCKRDGKRHGRAVGKIEMQDLGGANMQDGVDEAGLLRNRLFKQTLEAGVDPAAMTKGACQDGAQQTPVALIESPQLGAAGRLVQFLVEGTAPGKNSPEDLDREPANLKPGNRLRLRVRTPCPAMRVIAVCRLPGTARGGGTRRPALFSGLAAVGGAILVRTQRLAHLAFGEPVGIASAIARACTKQWLPAPEPRWIQDP